MFVELSGNRIVNTDAIADAKFEADAPEGGHGPDHLLPKSPRLVVRFLAPGPAAAEYRNDDAVRLWAALKGRTSMTVERK